MFIKLVPFHNDKRVYLVEGYRDENKQVKHRTVRCYGLLSELIAEDPNCLEILRREASLMEPTLVVNLQVNLNSANHTASKSTNYGYFFLNAIYEGLRIPLFLSNATRKYDISYNINHIMKLLVFSRILQPDSKKATYEAKDRFFNLNVDCSIDSLYRSLTLMNHFKEELEVWIHTQITNLIGRDTTLVFYDVTNYYFEIEYNDEDEVDEQGEVIQSGLRKKGVSKEHRPEPIIQMGMFIDKNGIPISYQLFSGNTHDKVTLLPLLQEMKAKYNLSRVLVVADKGLNSGKNLLYLKRHQDGYIVAQQIRNRKKEMIEKVLEEDGYVYNKNQDFKIKSWFEDKQVKDEEGKVHTLQEKVVCFWSKEFEDREKHKRGDIEDTLKKYIDKPSLYTASNAWGIKKYLKEKEIDKETGEVKKKNPILVFDEEKYRRDCELDGYYMLVTSELDLPSEEVIKQYKGLWQIEENFRVLKGDLEGRPVYVWTREHIEAHFLICFVSLVIMRILQYQLAYKYSASAIQKALKEAHCKHIEQEIYSLEPQNEVYRAIEKVYKVELDRAYARNSELKEYKRKIKFK